jgi:predicted PurR-regulated permease PerM
MSSETEQNAVSSEELPQPKDGTRVVSRAAGLLIAGLIIAALYFASEVLIPITLAALLTFILAPLVNLLRRMHVPRVPATVVAVLLAVGVIIGIAAVIGSQVADLAGQLPAYQTSIENKLSKLRENTIAPLTRAISRFESHSEQKSASTENQHSADQNAPKPVPVQVQQPALTPIEIGQKVIAPIFHPLATIAIMFVVTIFALLYREDIRDRAIRLFGSTDLSRATSAMDEAAHGLSRYFIVQLAINAGFGVVVALGTYVIGLPHPLLWGVLGGVLRFVPYIGAWLSAALAILVAAAVDPGWSMVLLTAALFGTSEFLAGQILEPLLYGHSTGLAPIAVVVSAIFWTWLWGPIGLIISTPLTLCAVVIGRHFEPLSFFDILFGSRPALRPSEMLYQRLLAGDLDEAEEQIEKFVAEHSLADYYDNVAVEALQLAAIDFRSGKLPPLAAAKLRSTFEEVTEVAEQLRNGGPAAESADTSIAPGISADTQVLCLPGRGPFDNLATLMIAQLFRRRGIEASTSLHEAASRRKVGSLELKNIAAVCVLYLEITGTPANIRFLIRRLKQRNPETKVVLGLLQRDALSKPEQIALLGADEYVSSLKEALNSTERLLGKLRGSDRPQQQTFRQHVAASA